MDYPLAYATAIAQPAVVPGFKSPTTPNHFQLPSSSGTHCDELAESQIKQLKAQGFTTGLAKALTQTKETFPLRIWVVDNSGSMNKDDGNRIVETKHRANVKIVRCTRWAEIQECVNYHVQLSSLLQAPTAFRLLNNPGCTVGSQMFSVADKGEEFIGRDADEARNIMNKARPNGVTPLTRHILEVRDSVAAMAQDLNDRGQRVALVLATDGLPTNEQGYGGKVEQDRFVDALRSLESLPLWIVVRLCTDEEDVVEFYNDLDEQLELSIEVLDDFIGEAEEVNKHNKWLNYALPLHRMREMGFHDRVFDMLDERALSREELRQFCLFLFGVENMDGMPDPAADWEGFASEVDKLNRREEPQWNPRTKRSTAWIDVAKLNKHYGDSSCSIM
jgi:hypothetical protein